MRLSILASCALAGAGLMACSPTFNWREVRLDPTGLVALLPCKPDQAVRPVTMGSARMNLHMQGCEAGHATFAVAFAQVEATAGGDKADASELLAQWKTANLAALKAQSSQSVPFRVAGAVLPVPQQVSAVGQKANGERVESLAVYFAQGPQLFYAVVLADHIQPDVAESFFSGLKLP